MGVTGFTLQGGDHFFHKSWPNHRGRAGKGAESYSHPINGRGPPSDVEGGGRKPAATII